MLNEKDLDSLSFKPIGLHAEQGKNVLLAGKHLCVKSPLLVIFYKVKNCKSIAQ